MWIQWCTQPAVLRASKYLLSSNQGPFPISCSPWLKDRICLELASKPHKMCLVPRKLPPECTMGFNTGCMLCSYRVCYLSVFHWEPVTSCLSFTCWSAVGISHYYAQNPILECIQTCQSCGKELSAQWRQELASSLSLAVSVGFYFLPTETNRCTLPYVSKIACLAGLFGLCKRSTLFDTDSVSGTPRLGASWFFFEYCFRNKVIVCESC